MSYAQPYSDMVSLRRILSDTTPATTLSRSIRHSTWVKRPRRLLQQDQHLTSRRHMRYATVRLPLPFLTISTCRLMMKSTRHRRKRITLTISVVIALLRCRRKRKEPPVRHPSLKLNPTARQRQKENDGIWVHVYILYLRSMVSLSRFSAQSTVI